MRSSVYGFNLCLNNCLIWDASSTGKHPFFFSLGLIFFLTYQNYVHSPDVFKAGTPSTMFCQDDFQVIVQGYELAYFGLHGRC